MYTKKMSFLLSTPLSTHSCFHRQDRNYYLHIRNFSNHIYWNSYLLLISILWFSSFKFKMPANWMISKNINHKMQFYWSWWNLNFGTGFSFYQPSIILNNFEQTQDWESSDMKCLHQCTYQIGATVNGFSLQYWWCHPTLCLYSALA